MKIKTLKVKPNLKAFLTRRLVHFFTFTIVVIVVSLSFFGLDLKFIFKILFILLVFHIVLVIFKYFNYRATEYIVYRNRIEFNEAFLNKRKTILHYKYITNVSLEKSWFIDKIFGTGIITISTSGNWLTLFYVQNSDEVFKYLQKVVKKYRK